MSIQDYLEKMKEVQKRFLNFIESETDVEENYQNLVTLLKDIKILQNKDKIESILWMINRISENHYRHTDFYRKITQVLHFLLKNNKQALTNNEVFNVFKHNKRILLLLIDEKFIEMDSSIANEILNYPYQFANYPKYFYFEIKPFINDKKSIEIYNEIEIAKDQNFINYFKNNQKIGENESYLCSLLRQDSLDQFLSYSKNINLSFYSEIKPSIFETNIFLLTHRPTLIDYAAFFGSLNIFKFLFSQVIKEPNYIQSCWLYAIHCPNETIIELLVNNKRKQPPPDFNSIIKNPKPFNYDKIDPYEIVLEEAIKCHHNEVANFFDNKFINKKIKNLSIEGNFDKNIYAYGFLYCNYAFFPSDVNYKYFFYYACKYNYIMIVEFLLKNKSINLNIPII